MIVRQAVRADVPAMREIYNDEVLCGVATLDLHPRTMEERVEWFEAHNVDNHPLIVAEEGGEVMGYASLSPYRDKEAYRSTVELSIYVGKAHRRKGAATCLMREILEMAKKDARTHLVVSVITAGNEASVSLHGRFGFTYCGTIHEVGEKFGRLLDIENYELEV